MTERTGKEVNLVKLSDSDLVLENPEQDIRNLDVYDSSVADLYIDG